MFLTFQISQTQNCDRDPPKHDFWARPASFRIHRPADPRHGAWFTTPRTLAPEVRMTVVPNKLPQLIWKTLGKVFFAILT